MSNAEPSQNQGTADAHEDPIESIVHHMPVVLPVAGGVLMFLLAFIAVVLT